PFTISIVTKIPPQIDVQATIHYETAGWEIRQIKKSQDAMNLVRPSGELQIFELETEKLFLRMTVTLPEESPRQAASRYFVNQICAIADRFGVNITMPDKLLKKDYETIAL